MLSISLRYVVGISNLVSLFHTFWAHISSSRGLFEFFYRLSMFIMLVCTMFNLFQWSFIIIKYTLVVVWNLKLHCIFEKEINSAFGLWLGHVFFPLAKGWLAFGVLMRAFFLKKKPSITLPFLLVLLFSISANKLSLLLLGEFYLFLGLKIMTFELGPFGHCYWHPSTFFPLWWEWYVFVVFISITDNVILPQNRRSKWWIADLKFHCFLNRTWIFNTWIQQFYVAISLKF